MAASVAVARQLISILRVDRGRLKRIKCYYDGEHDDPYMPDSADAEYKLLAKRAITNWMPFLVETPVQAMFVDGFRPGSNKAAQASDDLDSPQWKHWQDSRLDARQLAVHRAALTYGHSFVLTEKNARGKIVSKGLSPFKTAALFEDPANDDEPYAALTVTEWPKDGMRGKARMWDGKSEFEVSFPPEGDTEEQKVTTKLVRRHGNSECPVTRFAAMIDLDGNTTGVVEPMIPLNDRLNQTLFDLLVAQTYGSFKVRWVTGMAPPLIMEPVYEEDVDTGEKVIVDYRPKTNEAGQPIPAPINHNARRFLFAEDEGVKFGSLDETPLGGFIESVDLAMRHISALSQTPPHHLLGQIANLSAEALQAAETAFSRKVETLRQMFGESWERVFRMAGELAGEAGAAEDMGGEVIWRDMEARSLSQTADALGKLSEQLQVPKRGLWRRVPGITQTELSEWEALYEEESAELALAQALDRATTPLSSSSSTTRTAPVAA